jgi:hypothetical protein
MGKSLVIFSLLIIAASLIQVSLISFPLALVLILIWFLQNGTKYISLLAFVFSFFLGVAANIPIWLVLLATTIALALFVLGRSFLPTRISVTIGLFVVSIITWEAVLISLPRLF